MFLQWQEAMRVGIPVIDDEHKQIIELLNRLHAAIECDESDVVLSQSLDEAMSYTEYYFLREEALLVESDYPDKEKHFECHTRIKKDLLNIREKFNLGQREGLSIDFMIFLKKWLVEHIEGSDQKIVSHLKKVAT